MKTLSKIFLALLLMANIARAQVVLPLGLGQKSSINTTCSYNDKLWVVSDEQNNFVIRKWDGSFWIPMADIPSTLINQLSSDHSQLIANAIYYFNNELYLAISHKISGKLLLIKTSGKIWEQINTDKISISNKIEFIAQEDKLLLCGKLVFDKINVSIIKIENNSCSIHAYSPAFQDINDYYSDFELSGNKIWAIGLFSSPLDPNKRYFSYFENNVWKIVDNPPGLFGFEGLGKYKERLIIVSKNINAELSLFAQSINQNIWDDISYGFGDWKTQSITDIKEINKILWVAGTFYNPVSNKKACIAGWDGINWSFPEIEYLADDIKLNGDKQIYVSGNFFQHQGLVLNKTGILDLGTALIAGKIFNDLNQNCMQDQGERSLQGIAIKLAPENIYTISDYNGRYYFPVDSQIKVHALEIIVPKHHLSTCERFIGTKHTNALTIAGIDFGIMPSGNHTDASIRMTDYTGWRARQGFEEHYKICVTNKGTKAIGTGRVQLTMDPRLNNWKFSQKADMLISNSAEWNLGNIPVGGTYCIDASATIPLSIPLLEKINFDVQVLTTDVQDEDLTDNKCTLTQNVVAAIDPNDKKTRQDFFVAPGTPTLDYKIRFQNTGTDTAYTVIVTDTIDQNLFIDKQFYNPVSHEENLDFSTKYWIAPDGKYRYKFSWRFNNILLPDSNTNEVASHGFIDYVINLRKETKVGTLIKNRAYIYFDYQEPIITNTALNVISLNTGINNAPNTSQINIHPNPAHDIVNLANPFKSDIKVAIFNTIGQSISNFIISPQSNYVLTTTGMSPGIYFVQVEGFSPVKILIY